MPLAKLGDMEIIYDGTMPVVNPQKTPIKNRDMHNTGV